MSEMEEAEGMLEEETLIREEREGEPWRIAMVKVVLVEKVEQDAQ